jgi:chromate transporter
MTTTPSIKTNLFDLFWIYVRLGCICFGGPVAHLGYFKDEFVTQRKWLSEERYAELLSFCQFVPGPSSSQLVFAIGWQRSARLLGGCVAWLGFTLPSALLMIGFAYGLFAIGEGIAPFIHGLLIAAVAVVANAVLSLGKKLCPDRTRILIALLSTVIVLLLPNSLMQISVILMGGLLGNVFFRKTTTPADAHPSITMLTRPSTVCIALATYTLALLLTLWMTRSDPGAIYAAHYQAGALVFGGGHIVLPLLNESIVAGGLVSESHFLAGYSAAQALPGPLFAFSAFLGAVGSPIQTAWLSGLGTLIAIFLPGILLLIGLLPSWDKLRTRQWAQAGLIGANAAVVGLLLAALITPVWSHGIQRWPDIILATVAFIALYRLKSPAWLIVFGCGAAGYIFA